MINTKVYKIVKAILLKHWFVHVRVNTLNFLLSSLLLAKAKYIINNFSYNYSTN